MVAWLPENTLVLMSTKVMLVEVVTYTPPPSAALQLQRAGELQAKLQVVQSYMLVKVRMTSHTPQ